VKTVLVIGGYGNFGTHITRKLVAEPTIEVIIAGRSLEKANALAADLSSFTVQPRTAVIDIDDNLPAALQSLKPDIVIHTSGPFQGQGYFVAEACIEAGCHYIDLADGREFVAGIRALDARAKAKGVTVISGASSVPCLTSAIIDHYMPEFQKITAVDYGITTAQRTNTGLATTQAVLGYAGRVFKTLIKGKMTDIYGWQGTVLRRYPELGYRLLGFCDIPDLELFPARYPDLQSIRFRAGLEIPLIHLCLWFMSWLVRLGVLKTLKPLAAALLKASRPFDLIGSSNSAFHMEMTGPDLNGTSKARTFYLLARKGHGPYIPSIPSYLCAKLLANGSITRAGAMPCMGLLSLDQYLEGMSDLDIRIIKP